MTASPSSLFRLDLGPSGRLLHLDLGPDRLALFIGPRFGFELERHGPMGIGLQVGARWALVRKARPWREAGVARRAWWPRREDRAHPAGFLSGPFAIVTARAIPSHLAGAE